MFGRDPLTLSLRFQDAIFFEKFGDFHVIAQQNGYIGVTIPDRQLAMESLNIFMSLATLRGIPALAIRDNELGSITVDPDLGRIIRSSNTLTLPRMAPADPSYRLSTLELELREPLEIPTLRQLWEETESVSHHSPSAGLIYLFGQIYTQYQNEAYSETVIFASMWVEQLSHIARANYIVGEDFSPSHLRRPRLFDALRLFSEIEEIDPKIEIGLRDLVHARSGALHRNEKATKDQAESALLVVTHLIQTLPRLVRGS